MPKTLSQYEQHQEFLRRLEEEREAKNPKPKLRPHEVIVDGHEIPFDKKITRQSKVGKIAHLAREHGWAVVLGEATYRTADRIEKERIIEGKEVTWRWVQGQCNGHHFSASTDLILYDGWPIGSLAELEVGLVEHGQEG